MWLLRTRLPYQLQLRAASQIIDGKAYATNLLSILKNRVGHIAKAYPSLPTPRLDTVLVGQDPASAQYVKNKELACRKVGVEFNTHRLPAASTELDILDLIDKLNHDEETHGIMVQLPLPAGVFVPNIIQSISPEKDIDGLHAYNLGKTLLGQGTFYPCTAVGILRMLHHYHIPTHGRHVVILGKSNIVGKPLGMIMMENGGATVTICDKFTRNMHQHTRNADILVVAIGQPWHIQKEMVSEGVVVVDVGINRVKASGAKQGYVVKGDIHPDVFALSSYYTPVPGGVGPVTVAMLVANTVQAFWLQNEMNLTVRDIMSMAIY